MAKRRKRRSEVTDELIDGVPYEDAPYTEQEKSTHYVDNDKLWQVLADWEAAREQAKAENKPEPPVPTYAAEAILLITENLARLTCYAKSPIIDDMKGDAIQTAIRYIRSFKPQETKHPFAYFTQVIKRQFWRTMNDEKEYRLKIDDVIESAIGRGSYEEFKRSRGEDDDLGPSRSQGDYLRVTSEDLETYRISKAKKKNTPESLHHFTDEE